MPVYSGNGEAVLDGSSGAFATASGNCFGRSASAEGSENTRVKKHIARMVTKVILILRISDVEKSPTTNSIAVGKVLDLFTGLQKHVPALNIAQSKRTLLHLRRGCSQRLSFVV